MNLSKKKVSNSILLTHFERYEEKEIELTVWIFYNIAMFSTTSLVSKYTSLFGELSSDIIFLLSIVFLLFAFTVYFGSGKTISFIFAFYPATLLYKTFPFIEKLVFLEGNKLILLNKLAIFLLFLTPLTIIINRYVFSVSDHAGYRNIIHSAGLAIVATVLILIFSYGTLSLDLLHNFGSQIDSLFVDETRLFYWNVGSIILLAFL